MHSDVPTHMPTLTVKESLHTHNCAYTGASANCVVYAAIAGLICGKEAWSAGLVLAHTLTMQGI